MRLPGLDHLELASVLVVVAHPDDESFGLGAIIEHLTRGGVAVDVLCLTRGEASTLRGVPGDLDTVRTAELAAAAAELGVRGVDLRSFPDGGLANVPSAELEAVVGSALEVTGDTALLVLDPAGGVSGHPDHRAASLAALTQANARGLPAFGWALPDDVTEVLNAEFGAAFHGYPPAELHVQLSVERSAQVRAARCHASQALPESVLWRRLELQGDREALRVLAAGH